MLLSPKAQFGQILQLTAGLYQKRNFGLIIVRKEMPLLENVPSRPNRPSPKIFTNSNCRSFLGQSSPSNPICKVNYSKLMTSHYTIACLGITDTGMIARVRNVLMFDTPICLVVKKVIWLAVGRHLLY